MVLLAINQVIGEVVGLVHPEVQRYAIRLRTDLAVVLPLVVGDRDQLQQVLLHLVLNSIEAMRTVMDRPRELLIRSARTEADDILVTVQDAGLGLDLQTLLCISDAFFTTRPTRILAG